MTACNHPIERLKPGWMEIDVWEPCPCVLLPDHNHEHLCKHGVKEANDGATEDCDM